MMAGNTNRKGSRKLKARPIFGGIRKPVAPPGHPLTQAKSEAKARPAGRKAKHKRRSEDLANLAEVEDSIEGPNTTARVRQRCKH